MNNSAINIRISSYKIRTHLHGYNWCQSEADKLDFQRFFTSFASVLVAVTQTGLRSFSLNIYLEIKPHTCFSLLLIQLSFSLKVLTVININKQTLIDWDHQPERSLCFVSLCNYRRTSWMMKESSQREHSKYLFRCVSRSIFVTGSD